jgi:hypothetical protein
VYQIAIAKMRDDSHGIDEPNEPPEWRYHEIRMAIRRELQ